MRIERHLTALLAVAALGMAACSSGDAANDEAASAEMAADAPASEAAAGTMQQEVPLPEGVTAEMVSAGQQIFTGKGICYTCHGMDGTGTQLAPNLTDETWLNVPADPALDDIVQLVKSGVPSPVEHPAPMPAMGGANLSDEEVQNVAAYVLSLSAG